MNKDAVSGRSGAGPREFSGSVVSSQRTRAKDSSPADGEGQVPNEGALSAVLIGNVSSQAHTVSFSVQRNPQGRR